MTYQARKLQTTAKDLEKIGAKYAAMKSDVRLQHKCVAAGRQVKRLRMWNRIRNELEETVAPRRT